MSLSTEQVRLLVTAFLEEQGLKPFYLNADCMVFSRILNPRNSVIGSISIPLIVKEMDAVEAEKFVRAKVMEACRAAASEPVNRARND